MGRKKLAVVVDDDKMIRNLLGSFLRSLGYETELYECATDMPCVKKHSKDHCQFKNGPPEVMISDIRMPEMSGPEFLLDAKNRGCKAKKVAVISGFWEDKEAEMIDQIDCKKFRKPFTLKKLSDWLDE